LGQEAVEPRGAVEVKRLALWWLSKNRWAGSGWHNTPALLHTLTIQLIGCQDDGIKTAEELCGIFGPKLECLDNVNASLGTVFVIAVAVDIGNDLLVPFWKVLIKSKPQLTVSKLHKTQYQKLFPSGKMK
jgi:hypothetical protein